MCVQRCGETGATLGAGTIVMRGPVRLWAPVCTARRVS